MPYKKKNLPTVEIKWQVKTHFGSYFCTERKGDGVYVGTLAGSLMEGAYGALREIRVVGPHDEVATDKGTVIKVRLPVSGNTK